MFTWDERSIDSFCVSVETGAARSTLEAPLLGQNLGHPCPIGMGKA